MQLEDFFEKSIHYFENESWMLKVFIVVFITLTVRLIQKNIFRKLIQKLNNTRTFWDHVLFVALNKPLGLLIWIIGLSIAAKIVQANTESTIFTAVDSLRNICIIIAITWFFVRFIKKTEINLLKQGIEKGKPIDVTTADAIAKLLRASVIITAALIIIQSMGYSISGLLAFGGIGGIAIGFAAKDLLANFFGGLMIYLDRPFNVGDWIRSPDREIEGTVEAIGWRLTTICTFDKRPLYVPNAVFANISVQNPSRMRNRRIYETIGIRYDDVNKMATIVEDVKLMLQNHDEIDNNQTLIVNFNKFAPSSLDFFVYTMTKTTDWVKYHAVKQDVMLKIINIIESHNAECAFPTSTIHLKNTIDSKMPPR